MLKERKTKNKTHFVFIGQIEKHKGIFILINCFNKLKNNKYTLKIIGTGKELNQAKALAKNNHNISFEPWKPPEQIESALKSADYCIVPSICYENSPTIIFQSLHNKTPVIASNIGGIPELVKNNFNGYLFQPGNQQHLLKILEKLTK